MNNDINHPVLKTISAIGVFATIDFWSNLGKVCAAMYSLAILSEWMWKKLLKPYALRRRWIKGPPMDFLDTTGRADL